MVRSAAGGHFRLQTTTNVNWDAMVGNFVSEDATVLLADSNWTQQSVSTTTMKSSSARGSDQELAQEWLKVESRCQNCKSVDVLEDGSVVHRDSSYNDKDLLRVFRKMPLPAVPYTDLELSGASPIVLVVGGETHGLSHAAYKLAHDFGGRKVCQFYFLIQKKRREIILVIFIKYFQVSIPLENGVDSLNAGVAFGVLGYEIRRQLLGRNIKTDASLETSPNNAL